MSDNIIEKTKIAPEQINQSNEQTTSFTDDVIHGLSSDLQYIADEKKKEDIIKARALISESQDAARSVLHSVLNFDENNEPRRTEQVLGRVLFLLNLNPSLDNFLNTSEVLPKIEAAIRVRMLYDLKWGSSGYSEKLPDLSKFSSLMKIFTDVGLKIVKENPEKSFNLFRMIDFESETTEKNPEWHKAIHDAMVKCKSYYEIKQLAQRQGIPLEKILDDPSLVQPLTNVFKIHAERYLSYSGLEHIKEALEDMKEMSEIVRFHPEVVSSLTATYTKVLRSLLLDWHQYENDEEKKVRIDVATEILSDPSLNEFRSEFIRQLNLSDIRNLFSRGFLNGGDMATLDALESTQEKGTKLLAGFNANNHYGYEDDKALVMFCIDNLQITGSKLARILVGNISSDRPILNLYHDKKENIEKVWKKSGLNYQDISDGDSVNKDILLRLAECLAGHGVSALHTLDIFHVSDDFLKSAEVQRAAEKGIASSVVSSSFHDAEKINKIIEIRDRFLVPQDRFVRAVEEGTLNFIKHQGGGLFAGINGFRKVVNNIGLTQGFLSSDDLSQWGINCIVEIRSKYSHHEAVALEIREKFGLNISVENILRFVPSIKKLLDDMQEISPEFVAQAKSSLDLLFSLAEFKDNPEYFISIIKESPFLLDAVSGNRRFGSRLLVYFSNFDEVSRNNIKSQFAFKKEILVEHPEIDPESLEFRVAMQERLKEYGKNTDILASAEVSGINTEQWLNYDETRYFKLESGDSVLAFSETIATPINRIKETIDSYAHTIKEVLKEYRQELSVFEIALENPKEIEDRIAEMTTLKESALSEGNTKKSEGIQKGIDNLIQKKQL